MGYVHYCVFCGHAADAGSATMLAPSCPSCGCALRACPTAEFPAIAATLADQRVRRPPRVDGAGPLAVMTAGPFLLPLVGVEIRDVIFGVPLLFLAFAAVLAWAAARRPGEPAAAWRAYAAAAGIAAAATAVGIVLHVLGHPLLPAYHAGLGGSLALLAAVALHARSRLRHARLEGVLDAAQVVVLVLAAAVYFVLARDGDGLLRAVVGLDLLAFAGAALLAIAGRRRQDVLVGRRVWAMTACVLLADILAVGGTSEEAAAALYALAGWLLAGAAVSERVAPRTADAAEPSRVTPEKRWLAARILLPTAQVLAFPAVLALALADGGGAGAVAWFGAAFLLVLLLGFGRQAYLLIDHRRAVIEERRVRRAAQRRNEELEALTGLATTMTQTLEEAPIVEQALTVLHAAARASSSALHVREDGRRRLRASAGRWQAEHPWADGLGDGDEVERVARGGRQVTRLPLAARGHHIGWVTLVRPQSDPLTDRELELLRLLVDQMAVAVQNARDYREKLEQAVRDPLTGIYNRRYFFEALEKEVQRARRYGSHASLVLFDVDDFKRINDTHGHAVGDDVLRAIAATVSPLLRPVDSFARIGGEEFALLLPETRQLDALLVAERVRAAVARELLAPGVSVTVSAGVGACPQDAGDREELVRRTDAALYWAKRNGKDLCAVVNEATDRATSDQPAAAGGRETLRADVDTVAGVLDIAAAFGELRASRPADEAAAELRRLAGVRFDPKLVDAFVRAVAG